MFASVLFVLLILISGAVWSVATQRLTLTAAVTGAVIGGLLFAAFGWTGLVSMTAFFLMGTLATSWKRKEKKMLEHHEETAAWRTTAQVLANSGLAGLLALFAFFLPSSVSFLSFLVACVFSSAAADTVSSELGMVYGKQPFNILTFQAEKRGLDGVISIAGLMFGIAASTVIALLFLLFAGSARDLMPVVIAGTAGNLADSIMGALWERKGAMKNNTVNFLNTLASVITGALLQVMR